MLAVLCSAIPLIVEVLVDCPAETASLLDCFSGEAVAAAPAGLVASFFMAVVVAASIAQKWKHCRRHVPIYSPLKAYRVSGKMIVRAWQPYKAILVFCTEKSYQWHDWKHHGMLGEFVIPFVLVLWIGWPSVAGYFWAAGLQVVETGSAGADGSASIEGAASLEGTDGASSTWTAGRVLVLSIGAAISLLLGYRALRVLNKYWQDPLAEAERKELRAPKLALSSLQVQLAKGNSVGEDDCGFTLRLLATKDPTFTAERVRLQVGDKRDNDDPFWKGLGKSVGTTTRLAALPMIRSRALPYDLVDGRCFVPEEALRRGSKDVSALISFGLDDQSVRVKSRTVLKFLGKLHDTKICPDDPVASVRVEYKTDKHWATLFELSVSPREVWKALRPKPGTDEGVRWVVEGDGWLDVDSTGTLLARTPSKVRLKMPQGPMPEPEPEPESPPTSVVRAPPPRRARTPPPLTDAHRKTREERKAALAKPKGLQPEPEPGPEEGLPPRRP